MKKFLLRGISTLLCLITVLSVMPAAFASAVTSSPTDIEALDAYLATLGDEAFITTEKGNAVQKYVTEDNKKHTIYWAQGVKPPKMTNKKELIGKPGYFEKDVTVTPKITNITYQAPMQDGMGYYDLNKSLKIEERMCYLASTTNILQWWFEQNEKYIRQYEQGIKDGKFLQEEGLVDLNTVDWDYLYKFPTLVEVNGFRQQLLRDSPLVKTAFKNNYYKRYDDGYWMDPVFDFIMNGYKPIHPIGADMAPINHPGMYEKDKDGGYFFPLFGKEPITKRFTTANYDFYNRSFKEWLLTGKMISIGYLINNTTAHAITAWGAEYDENGNLCRMFVTDSDDYYNSSLVQFDTIRGLVGINIKEYDGLLYMGNNEGPAANRGNVFTTVAVIGLEQDRWEAILNDKKPLPDKPIIEKSPLSRLYAFNADANELTVKATLPAEDREMGAYLTYQWYKATADGVKGEAITGANKASYKPVIGNTLSTDWYYCEVTNNKYGHKETVKSASAKIETAAVDLVNAARPDVDFYYGTQSYPQFSSVWLTAQVNNPADLDKVTYQWYRASNNSDGGYTEPLAGQTEARFKVPTDTQGNFYYYCIVTNTDSRASVTGNQIGSYKTGIKRIKITEPVESLPQEALIISGVPEFPVLGQTFKPEILGGSGQGLTDFQVIGSAVKNPDGTVTVTGEGEIKLIAVKEGDGNYEAATAEIKVISVYGDNDGDGKVSLNDAMNIILYISKQSKEINFKAADIDKDERLTLKDTMRIVEFVAKKTDRL